MQHSILQILFALLHMRITEMQAGKRIGSECCISLDCLNAANCQQTILSFLFLFQQDDGNTLEGKYGEFWFEFNSGSLFSVTKYEGFEDRHYVCLHSSSLNLYHQGRGEIEVALGLHLK